MSPQKSQELQFLDLLVPRMPPGKEGDPHSPTVCDRSQSPHLTGLQPCLFQSDK